MNIAIFGEKEEFLNFEKKIYKLNKEQNYNLLPNFYEDKQALIQNIKDINIFVLIHSNNYDNIINIAPVIKKNNPSSKIIFCCKTAKWAVQGYKLDIYYYILMPFSYEEFKFAIKKCTKLNDEVITINSNWQKIPIAIKDIHFVEKQGHNIIIHTTDRNFSTRVTFKKFVENFKYNKNFSNCIRGTIVNFDWVDSIKLQNFLMKSGEKIPIRRKDRKKIKELFYNHERKKYNI